MIVWLQLAGESEYGEDSIVEQCLRENSVLHLFLALGTVWMALYIYNFTKTCVPLHCNT